MKVLLLLLALIPEVAFTSQEGVLVTSSVLMESEGIGESGHVLVQGKRAPSGEFTSLKVEAFGKKMDFPPELLKLIPAQANGILLTYEAGYKDLGGRTLYITFQKGFTSGVVDVQTFSANESGNIRAQERPNKTR